MMMIMMMIMKLVKTAMQFRHGIYKFYEPNWGLRSSKSWDEALYTYIYIYIYIHIFVYSTYVLRNLPHSDSFHGICEFETSWKSDWCILSFLSLLLFPLWFIFMEGIVNQLRPRWSSPIPSAWHMICIYSQYDIVPHMYLFLHMCIHITVICMICIYIYTYVYW